MNTPGAFSFAVLNDLHYMDAADVPWLEGVVREVNALPGLELVLVLGDLAESGTREELAAAKEILGGLRAPYYVVPGNHDGPDGRAPGLGEAGLSSYVDLFPGRRNYTFSHKGWQFLALDTTDGSGYHQLPVNAEARAYAREAARALDPAAPTILFTHFPLAPTVRFTLSDGHALLEDLRGVNLRIVFSGHFHGATVHAAPGRPGVALLTHPCCSRTRELHDGSEKRGYVVCRAHADLRVTYAFKEYRGPG